MYHMPPIWWVGGWWWSALIGNSLFFSTWHVVPYIKSLVWCINVNSEATSCVQRLPRFTTTNSIPPCQQQKDRLIVNCCSNNHTDVEDLMAIERQIKLARIQTLRNAHGIKCRTSLQHTPTAELTLQQYPDKTLIAAVAQAQLSFQFNSFLSHHNGQRVSLILQCVTA